MSLFSVHPTMVVCMGARRTVTIAEQLCCATVLVRRCVNVYFCFLTTDHFPSHIHTSQIYCDSLSHSLALSLHVFFFITHIYLSISFIHFEFILSRFVKTVSVHTPSASILCVPTFFSISSSTKILKSKKIRTKSVNYKKNNRIKEK